MKITWGVLLVLGVLVFTTPVKAENTSGNDNNYTYDFCFKIYEFHADFIKCIEYGRCFLSWKDEQGNKYIPVSMGSLYSAQDVYGVEVSESISRYETSIEKDSWRGVSYETVRYKLFLPTSTVEEKVKYEFSYKVRRMPMLHEMTPISLNRSLHLGVNLASCKSAKYYFEIFALPGNSEVEEVFGYLPDEKMEAGGWKLFIYDRGKINENIAPHLKFKLFSDAFETLKIEEICEEIMLRKKERDDVQ